MWFLNSKVAQLEELFVNYWLLHKEFLWIQLKMLISKNPFLTCLGLLGVKGLVNLNKGYKLWLVQITRNSNWVYLGIERNYILEAHTIASYQWVTEVSRWVLFMGKRNLGREKPSESSSNNFIGLRVRRDSWRMFMGQEIRIDFLVFRHLVEISLSVKFHSSEGACVRFSILYTVSFLDRNSFINPRIWMFRKFSGRYSCILMLGNQWTL